MTTYDYDLNALATATTDGTEDDIKKALGAISAAAKEAASVPPTVRPRTATLHLLAQLGEIVNQVVTGTYTRDGVDTLLTKQPLFAQSTNGTPLALGAGSVSTTKTNDEDVVQIERLKALGRGLGVMDLKTFVDNIDGMLASLTGPIGDDQRMARLLTMSRVGDGTIGVQNDGTLVAEEKLNFIVAELAQARTDLTVAEKDRDAYKRFADQFPGLHTMPATADRRARIKGMQLVADGTTPVNPDGTADMGTTHPVAVHRDNLNVKLNDANADLKKAKDELKLKTDAIADVKAQARKPHMGNAADRVVPVSKLTDETAKVFGWTKP